MILTYYIKTDENGKNRTPITIDERNKILSTIIDFDLASKSVCSTLKSLRSKGNIASSDLLAHKNSTVNLDDIISAITLDIIDLVTYGFISLSDKSSIALSGITDASKNTDIIDFDVFKFVDISCYREYTKRGNEEKSGFITISVLEYLAKRVCDILTNERTYGNKRVYLYETNDDGEEYSVFDNAFLYREYMKSHNEKPTLESLAHSNKVYEKTLAIVKASKRASTDVDVLSKRLIGCNIKQTAAHLGVTRDVVRASMKRLVKAYKQALKECRKAPKTDNLPVFGNRNDTTNNSCYGTTTTDYSKPVNKSKKTVYREDFIHKSLINGEYRRLKSNY